MLYSITVQSCIIAFLLTNYMGMSVIHSENLAYRSVQVLTNDCLTLLALSFHISLEEFLPLSLNWNLGLSS